MTVERRRIWSQVLEPEPCQRSPAERAVLLPGAQQTGAREPEPYRKSPAERAAPVPVAQQTEALEPEPYRKSPAERVIQGQVAQRTTVVNQVAAQPGAQDLELW